MAKALKNRASKQGYISPLQGTLAGFESPFSNHLNAGNRWVVLAHKIPWDSLVNVYQKQLNNSLTGADGTNPRVVLGSLIIKHICDLSDREIVQQIQENMYMQYFIGFSSFSDEAPFDPSLFVEFRKRLGVEQINTIYEKILQLYLQKAEGAAAVSDKDGPPPAKNNGSAAWAGKRTCRAGGNNARGETDSGCHGLPAGHQLPDRPEPAQ